MKNDPQKDDPRKIFGRSSWQFGAEFEFCMRRCFGESAYGIANSSVRADERERWKRKLIRKLLSELGDLDTTERHRKHIEFQLECLLKTSFSAEDPSYNTVFMLLDLVLTLLGYEGVDGRRHYTPTYWTDLETHVARMNESGNGEELMEEYISSTERRTRIVLQLKKEGLSDFEVARVLRTSEYEIKKLKKEPI